MSEPANLNALRETCYRDMLRLHRLERKHRLKDLLISILRGIAGFFVGLYAVFKMHIAATLGGKLAIAALVGIGFAWPIAALTVFGIAVAIFIIFAVVSDGPGASSANCCELDGCRGKNTRRRRLIEMIREREKWLERSEGPPPVRYNPHRYQQMTEWLGTLYKSERNGSRRDDPNP